MRSQDPLPSLNVEVFEIHRLKSTMSASDFVDDTKVQDIYCRELEKHFLEALGAKHVRALDYQVSTYSAFPPVGKNRLRATPLS